MQWKDVQHYDTNNDACVQALRERCLDGGRIAFQFQEAGHNEFARTRLLEIGQSFGINIFVFEREKFPVAWQMFHKDACAVIFQMRTWWVEGYLQARAEWQKTSRMRKEHGPMTALLFPAVALPKQVTLAGTFSRHGDYHAKVLVSAEIRTVLQEMMKDAYLLEEGENPKILADWSFCRSDPEHDSSVFFFRDGSDYLGAEDEDEHNYRGVLFGRCDCTLDGHALTWRVHIPNPQQQITLLTAADYALEYTNGNITKLDVIHTYLLSVLNEQSAWCVIEGAGALEESRGSDDSV